MTAQAIVAALLALIGLTEICWHSFATATGR
jgi:hypothetical protein